MREKQIDIIGFVGELQKHLAEPLKDRVKHTMGLKGADRAEADYFSALLVQGTIRTIDPSKFLQLYERGKLTRAQFVLALRINREAAAESLSGEEIDRISEQSPATPALRVTRIKGVDLSLAESVKQIAAQVDSDDRRKSEAA